MQAILTAVRSAMGWTMVLGCVVATMHGEAVQAWGQTADAATDANELARLDLVGTIPARKAMDAAVSGNYLFFVGANTLWVADLKNPYTPAVVGSARFDGNGRQIAVENGVAYVTARADGLYIFDVSAPETPRLLSHYDTMKLPPASMCMATCCVSPSVSMEWSWSMCPHRRIRGS